ncbi:MAG: WhiB family transcriptional regulator [Acidimicrobiales bacterium]|nr:WhiB family transcriptional regulator [Actinomycetota bacterium]
MKLSWRQRGACVGLDPDVFYPPSDEESDEAKAICASCPVQEPCLEFALDSREADGIWGGTTARERRRLLRQRRKTAAA